jgi:predicted nucleic acid-binding protein
MKIYLDNCVFNRPFDTQSNIKTLLETEAKLNIQENIRRGNHELVWSYILDYENLKNPFQERQEQIAKWKQYAKIEIKAEDSLIQRAKSLKESGLKSFDALHIACAITAGAEYFLTTDKGVLKKAAIIRDIQIKNPIDFIREV